MNNFAATFDYGPSHFQRKLIISCPKRGEHFLAGSLDNQAGQGRTPPDLLRLTLHTCRLVLIRHFASPLAFCQISSLPTHPPKPRTRPSLRSNGLLGSFSSRACHLLRRLFSPSSPKGCSFLLHQAKLEATQIFFWDFEMLGLYCRTYTY